MFKKSYFIVFVLCFVINVAYSQEPFNHSHYEGWKVIGNTNISNDGRYISYEVNPLKGDGILYIKEPYSGFTDSVNRGKEARFSPSGKFIAFRIGQPADSVRKAKLEKKKESEMPKDSFGIKLFTKDSILHYAGFKSFKLPVTKSDWIAFMLEKPKEVKKDKQEADTASSGINKNEEIQEEELKGKTTPKKNETPKKKKTARKDVFDLFIMNPLSGDSRKITDVTDYEFSRNGDALIYIRAFGDSIDSCAVQCFFTINGSTLDLFTGPGKAAKPAADTSGKHFAFIHGSDTSKSILYSLYYRNIKDKTNKIIVDTTAAQLPVGMKLSEHGNIFFSRNGKRLFFGISPPPEKESKDSIPDDEKVNLDLWSWTDSRLQSQQLKELKEDKKSSFLAVCELNKFKIIPLADSNIRDISLLMNGNADVALGKSYEQYQKSYSWEGSRRSDIYLINLVNGEKELLLKDKQSYSELSPSGKYLLSYNAEDSTWNCMSIKTMKSLQFKAPEGILFANEDNDIPALPSPYGVAGWTKNDKAVIIYDKYDLWKFDPEGNAPPLCITKSHGRNNKTIYRYLRLNSEYRYIDDIPEIILDGFNDNSCENGFYALDTKGASTPIPLYKGAFRLSRPLKARDNGRLVFERATFSEYPDIWYCDTSFKSPMKVSDVGPQTKKFLWGDVEQVSWVNFQGKEMKGLMYKPHGLDENNKYPMIVYFYEKHSDNLHQFYHPGPSRSIISPTIYTSNGYAVFMPDISYRDGYPGESALESIMSGTISMLSKYKWINKDRLGLQGQSWGGYQTAYIVTRSNMFRAAMAGAPVSNMVSAYGAIRDESGLSRMFQYEKTQSRIGKSLWESPMLYISNSPVFYADNINTPLLIMANDNDGAVPWQQGIELFTALRRLEKPSWLLNYNNDAHNLLKWPNRVDLSKRMQGFFDYYLKDAPMPQWMETGIPAIKKGKYTGF